MWEVHSPSIEIINEAWKCNLRTGVERGGLRATRADADEDVCSGRTAAERFAGAGEETVAQDGERQPVRAAQVGFVFGDEGKSVRGGSGAQDDVRADGVA